MLSKKLFLKSVTCFGVTLFFVSFFSCETKAQSESIISDEISEKMNTSLKKDTLTTFLSNYIEPKSIAKSVGTVGNGSLQNGKLLPFSGNNFRYFDTLSYVSSRAFVHDYTRNTILQAMKQLETLSPKRTFWIMEASCEKGGKIEPHKTHQNGLSVDFMIPLTKNATHYSNLDSLGGEHYLLSFDNQGNYSRDSLVKVDFEELAKEIYQLHKNAAVNKLRIDKVILKTEWLPLLYATKYGKLLKAEKVYFAQKLTPLINSLHDDHFHVDFKLGG